MSEIQSHTEERTPVRCHNVQFMWIFLLVIAMLIACDGQSNEGFSAETGIESIDPATADASVESDSERRIARIPSQTCHIPDPAIDRASDGRSITIAPIVHEIHAGLFSLSKGGLNEVDPELAESYVVWPSGRTYDFVLRKDLKFSDGSVLTSADVRWSWERALKMSMAKGRARSVLGSIIGASDLLNRKSEELTGFNIVDDRRFRILLNRPNAVFPVMLTDPIASIVNKDNVAQWPVTWTNSSDREVPVVQFEPHQLPVGAGPFALAEFSSNLWDGGCRIALNPHYWGESPKLDLVEYVTGFNPLDIDGSGQRVWDTFFETASIDLVPLLNEQISDALHQAEYGEIGVYSGDGPPNIAYLVFNPAIEPFDDVQFRRGLVAASDTTIFALNDRIPIADRLLTPSLSRSVSVVARVPYDPEAAQAFIKRSEKSTSIPLVYRTNDQGWFFETLGAMFDGWEDTIGITVVSSSDEGTVPEELQAMRLEYFSPSLPDPIAILSPIIEGFGRNDSTTEILELSKMLERASSEPDGAARAELYADAEQYALEQAFVLPIWSFEPQFEFKIQPWVHGFHVPQYSGSVFHHIEFGETAPKR